MTVMAVSQEETTVQGTLDRMGDAVRQGNLKEVRPGRLCTCSGIRDVHERLAQAQSPDSAPDSRAEANLASDRSAPARCFAAPAGKPVGTQ